MRALVLLQADCCTLYRHIAAHWRRVAEDSIVISQADRDRLNALYETKDDYPLAFQLRYNMHSAGIQTQVRDYKQQCLSLLDLVVRRTDGMGIIFPQVPTTFFVEPKQTRTTRTTRMGVLDDAKTYALAERVRHKFYRRREYAMAQHDLESALLRARLSRVLSIQEFVRLQTDAVSHFQTGASLWASLAEESRISTTRVVRTEIRTLQAEVNSQVSPLDVVTSEAIAEMTEFRQQMVATLADFHRRRPLVLEAKPEVDDGSDTMEEFVQRARRQRRARSDRRARPRQLRSFPLPPL